MNKTNFVTNVDSKNSNGGLSNPILLMKPRNLL